MDMVQWEYVGFRCWFLRHDGDIALGISFSAEKRTIVEELVEEL